jgi:hypothetical protein
MHKVMLKTPNVMYLWLLFCSPNFNSSLLQITSGIAYNQKVNPLNAKFESHLSFANIIR